MKPVEEEMVIEKLVSLPPIDRRIKKKTVIFDLDETLVHCNLKKDRKYDV